jgi:hypothetical protein
MFNLDEVMSAGIKESRPSGVIVIPTEKGVITYSPGRKVTVSRLEIEPRTLLPTEEIKPEIPSSWYG